MQMSAENSPALERRGSDVQGVWGESSFPGAVLGCAGHPCRGRLLEGGSMWAHLRAGGWGCASSSLGKFPPESGVQGRVGEEATGGRKWREGVWRGRSSGLGEVSWRGCGASSVTWLCRSPPVLSLACIAGHRKGLLIKIMDTEDDKHRCNLRPERISH